MRHDSFATPFAGDSTARRRRASTGRGLVEAVLKRATDIFVSAFLLILLSPVIAVLAIAIKLESRGPVFYRCRRVGRYGSELQMFKFRKMYDGAAGPALASAQDERFTRLGPVLARTKLDEVPQLWNVLRGHMSLVGPRPEDASFVALHEQDYELIHSVRPGITGYCQLAFARESEILDSNDREAHYVERILPQKVKLDCLYATRQSFVLDLKILWWTAMAVLLSREVAVHRQTGDVGRRAPRGVEELAPRTAA